MQSMIMILRERDYTARLVLTVSTNNIETLGVPFALGNANLLDED